MFVTFFGVPFKVVLCLYVQALSSFVLRIAAMICKMIQRQWGFVFLGV